MRLQSFLIIAVLVSSCYPIGNIIRNFLVGGFGDGQQADYEELEKTIKKLEQKHVIFNQAKQSVKSSQEKHAGLRKDHSLPEMAVEVIEQEDSEKKPVE